VKNYQVLSPLTCLTQDRFEIQATTAEASTDDRFRLMVQTLLADRFHLRLHRETRELPVYVLVTGKNGPKLTVTDLSNEGPQTPPRGINIGPTGMSSRNGTMDSLADILTTNLDRPVLDKTNLTGHYDFTLTWDQPPALAGSSIRAPIGPAIFAPIQSLGLRLEDQKAPVEMPVIDSVDHPRKTDGRVFVVWSLVWRRRKSRSPFRMSNSIRSANWSPPERPTVSPVSSSMPSTLACSMPRDGSPR
jgi:uncharacterized protein (TIGR03435 family)